MLGFPMNDTDTKTEATAPAEGHGHTALLHCWSSGRTVELSDGGRLARQPWSLWVVLCLFVYLAAVATWALVELHVIEKMLEVSRG